MIQINQDILIIGYETNRKYDYRNYNIKKDNRELKEKILAIKNGYEVRD